MENRKNDKVSFFRTCPLKKGQKIRIEDSRFAGDWEIVDFTGSKVTLRCPVSGKELVKDRFLFFTHDEYTEWPDL